MWFAHFLSRLIDIAICAEAVDIVVWAVIKCYVGIKFLILAVAGTIAVIDLLTAYYRINISAESLSPHGCRLAALQKTSHLAAWELYGGLALCLAWGISTIDSCFCTYSLVVIAVGNCSCIISANAAGITRIGMFDIAGMIAVGYFAAEVISAYATDIGFPIINCTYMIAIGDGG